MSADWFSSKGVVKVLKSAGYTNVFLTNEQ